MKNKLKILALASLIACGSKPIAATSGSVLTECGDNNLLTIGDSISVGYEPTVRSLIGDKMFIDGIKFKGARDKARTTDYTLSALDKWLAQCDSWKVITWNNGIWDSVATEPNTQGVTSFVEYRSNIAKIAKRLVDTGAKVIFFTTTPLGKGAKGQPYSYLLVDEYNQIAKDVLKDFDVTVANLNGYAAKHLEYRNTDGIHYSVDGYKYLGRYVADTIKAVGELSPE